MKEGDEVDALDRNTGVFYNSTVISVKGNQLVPKIVVGNRIYHKDGDKEDALGKYFGKSSVCDEEIPLFSIRI